jgi:hypothetical protein
MTREDYENEVSRLARTCAYRAKVGGRPLGAVVFNETYEHNWFDDNCEDLHMDILKFTKSSMEAPYSQIGQIVAGELAGDSWRLRIEVAATIALQNDVLAQAEPILKMIEQSDQ